jgi:hypothetical protein
VVGDVTVTVTVTVWYDVYVVVAVDRELERRSGTIGGL